VDAALGLQHPVGVLALHGEGGGLEPRLLAGARLDQLGLEAAVSGPAEIHAQKDLGPVLRICAARAGVNRDDGVAGVVLTAEEGVLLQSVELAPERRNRRLDLVCHLAVHGVELAGVLELVLQAAVAIESLGQTRVLGGNRCCPVLIVPEARCAHLGLELCDAPL
jgi:hypothetical protein